MLFKKGNINKAISATMLLMLLFIHSVKLLHSHASTFPDSSCSSNGLDINDIAEKSIASDCNLCSYQLGKDADDLVQLVFNASKAGQNIFIEQLVSFYKSSFSSGFESRGPPQS